MTNPLHVVDTAVEFTEVLPFEHPFHAFEKYLYRPDMSGFSTESYTELPPIYRRVIALRTVHRLQELIPGVGPPKRETARTTPALPAAVGDDDEAAAVPIPAIDVEDAALDAQVYAGRDADWKDRLILSCLFRGSLDKIQSNNPSHNTQSISDDDVEEMDKDDRQPHFNVNHPFVGSRRESVNSSSAAGSSSLLFPQAPYDDLQTTASFSAELRGEVRYIPGSASIPVHMYDREYELYLNSGGNDPQRTTSYMSYASSSSHPPDRMPPDIQSHDVLMLIFSFLPAEMPTLLAVGTVCRAWRERSEYLAPHWDLAVANDRKDLYWAGREAAIVTANEGDENAGIENDVSNILRRLNSVIWNVRRGGPNAREDGENDDGDTAVTTVPPLFNPENDDNDAVGTEGGDDEEDEAVDPEIDAAAGGAAAEAEAAVVEEDPVVVARRKAYFPLLIHSRSDLLSKRYLLMIRDEETRECIVAMRTLGGIIMTMSVLVAFIFASIGAYFLGKSAPAMDTYSTLGVTYFFSVLGLGCCCRIFMLQHWCFPTIYNPFRKWDTDRLVMYWGSALTLVVGLVMALLCLRLRIVNERIDAPHFAISEPLESGLCPCDTYGGPPCSSSLSLPRSPIPSLLTATLPTGLSDYTWASTTPLTLTSRKFVCTRYLNTTCIRNASTTTSVNFLLAVSTTNSTGCDGASQMPRLFAMEVPSVNHTFVGTVDPLTALTATSRGGVVREGNSQDGKAIEIKVPFDNSVLDCGFSWSETQILQQQWYLTNSSDNGEGDIIARTRGFSTSAILPNTTAGLAAQYLIDNTPEPWRDAAIPIVRWEGDGGVESLIRAYIDEGGKHPWRAVYITAQFKSFETMRKEITGAWAAMLGGGILITCLLNISYHLTDTAVLTRPFSNRKRFLTALAARRIRKIVGTFITVLTVAIANPYAMVGWGAICGYVAPAREVCLMSDGQSATILILGIFVSVFATIASASVLCSYCRDR